MAEYKILQLHDLSNIEIVDILKYGIKESFFNQENIKENYLYRYKDKAANLFNVLESGRFKNGCYFVVVNKDNNFVASAGWNQYTADTALVLTRMIVHPDYRTKYVIGNFVLPIILEQTQKYNHVWITANDYNKSIYKWFDRSNEGKSTALFNNWPPIYKKFKPIGQRVVNHVQQWVAELEK